MGNSTTWRSKIRRRDTALEPTRWPTAGDRPRVLIEHHDRTIGVAVGNLLFAEGYDVTSCEGPGDRRGHRCPLAMGGDCPSAEDADVVFFGLDITDEDDREVLRAWRERHADIPVVVEIPPRRIPLYGAELEGCVTVARPVTRESLLDAVGRALR